MPQAVKSEPLYDICKTWEENCSLGPQFSEQLPKRIFPPKEKWIDLLGYKVASPLGVPAGPLLNSKWTTLAARLGFDILTYKTIRAHPFPSHPLPNILFVDTAGELTLDRMGSTVRSLGTVQPAAAPAITNSFGNPSKSPDYLKMDIHLARHALEEGQILIVSVFGVGRDLAEMTEDFCRAAQLAKEGGAHVIEANFSCPNVAKGGALYTYSEACYAMTKALVKVADPLPLIVKVGLFEDPRQCEKVFIALDRAGARGVEGINTVPMQVVDEDGSAALGKERLKSGICGAPIRAAALQFIRRAHTLIQEHKLGLTLLGCGGIVEPAHFDSFLQAGAEAALTATGMMWDPLLATRWHQHDY